MRRVTAVGYLTVPRYLGAQSRGLFVFYGVPGIMVLLSSLTVHESVMNRVRCTDIFQVRCAALVLSSLLTTEGVMDVKPSCPRPGLSPLLLDTLCFHLVFLSVHPSTTPKEELNRCFGSDSDSAFLTSYP